MRPGNPRVGGRVRSGCGRVNVKAGSSMTKSHGGRKLDTRTLRRRRSITLLSRGHIDLKAIVLRDNALQGQRASRSLGRSSWQTAVAMIAGGTIAGRLATKFCRLKACGADQQRRGPYETSRCVAGRMHDLADLDVLHLGRIICDPSRRAAFRRTSRVAWFSSIRC